MIGGDIGGDGGDDSVVAAWTSGELLTRFHVSCALSLILALSFLQQLCDHDGLGGSVRGGQGVRRATTSLLVLKRNSYLGVAVH